jgi:hypothetical protein
MFAVLGKVSKPVSNQLKSFVLDSVYARAAPLFMRQQSRPFQNSQMPRSGLPGMLEDCGDFPGRHRATVEINRKQHSASGSVR